MRGVREGDRRRIGSVQRAIDILNLFSSQVSELGTTEIAGALRLHKSTVAGLVSTLEANGYLDRSPVSRKYRLGLKLVERSSVLLRQIEVRKVALPLLERLREGCGESVNLAIRDGSEVVYVEQLPSLHPLGTRDEVGKRASVHCTALGKALVAWLPEGEVERVVGGCDLRAMTPNTITDAEQFLRELERTRERGYAVDDEEVELGVRCVAAPVFDHAGRVVAAVSVSVPVPRMPVEQLPHLAERVRQTAKGISTRLGYPERPY